MRLKKHREDVKDLLLMQSAHVQDIAKRYLNLIRMAEDSFNFYSFGGATHPDWKSVERRVLKDAE